MSAFRSLLTAKLRIAGHQLASVRSESKLKVAVVSLFTAGLWWSGFAGSRAALAWLKDLGAATLGPEGMPLGSLMTARLLSAFALVLFVLLVFSNVLVIYVSLFRAKEMPLLVTSPMGGRRLFLARWLDALFLSSWASAFLGSPLLLAFGLVSEAPWIFYPILVAAFLPLAVLAAALGAGLTLGVTALLTRFGRPAALVLGGGALIGAYLFAARTFTTLDPGQGGSLSKLLAVLGDAQHPWLPAQWAVDAIVAAARGRAADALPSLGLLFGSATVTLAAVTELAHRTFSTTWSAVYGTGRKKRDRSGRAFRLLDAVTRPLPEPARSLMRKDVRTFWRDPAQWPQFFLFFGIMAVYAANVQRTSPAYEADLWKGIITGLNGVVCLLILATLTTRFIYPLISLEGRRAWILGLAPVTWKQVLYQKLLLSLVSTSVFTVSLAALSSHRLQLGPRDFLLTLLSVGVATVALSGLAVGLGALFADFEQDSPARIVSGMGGTLNFILSLAFIALATTIQTALLQWPLIQSRTGLGFDQATVTTSGLALLLLAGALTTWLPLYLGLRNLERVEV